MSEALRFSTALLPRLAPLALALALAGCAATLAPRTVRDSAPGALPNLTPAASAVPEAGLAIERWWLLFGDTDLNRLVEEALAHNHDLAVAAARLREAQAQLDAARGAQSPVLDLQVSNSRARQSADALPPGAERTGSRRGVSLAGSYELDLWGRLAAGSDAARQRLQAQQWARASIQWSLTAQLAEAHFSLRGLQRQIDISQSVRAGRAQTLDLRQRERAAGIAGEFELRRAEAELAGADVTLASLRRQSVALQATVALLSGRSPAQVADTEAAAQPLDPLRPFTARLPQGDARQLLLRRPDLRQAEAELAASEADINAARAATLPAIRLSGSVGSDVRTMSNLFHGPGLVWSVAASVTQSLLDGGQARARVQQADARADAAQARYRKTVLGAVLDLREAYAALDLALQAQQAEQQRVAALERARSLAQLGVQAGALNQLDLIDAERHAFEARLAEVSAYRDRLISQVAAFKALGGGHTGAADVALNHP